MIGSFAGSDADLYDWATEAVSASEHGCHVVRAEPAASRTGRLYRLEVATGDRRRTYFVKAADASDTAARRALEQLPAVSRTFRRSSTTAFADVVATDVGHGWLLTAAVEGMPLNVYRRHVLKRLHLQGATSVWPTIGRWLHDLHSCLPPRVEAAYAQELVSYTTERLSRWGRQDPNHADVATRAIRAATVAGTQLGAARLVPCHGDVSHGNIVVADGCVTLIDFGDLRFDLPALDLSQAVMETREYGRLSSIVPLPFIGAASERGLRDGYGRDWPEGAAWWLPHLRNLAVYLVTLAPNRHRASEGFRYRRTRAELLRTIVDVERGSG